MSNIALAGDDGDSFDALERVANQMMQQAGMIKAMVQGLKKIDQRIDRIEQESGLRGGHWTVAAWIAHHGYSATREALKDEGSILRGICLQHRIAIPEAKVCNGGNFPARQWPIEAIRIWWPGCCARHGWKSTWKV